MSVRTTFSGAVLVVMSACALPSALWAQGADVPAPMMLGRWARVSGQTAPEGDALKRLCAKPATYIEVAPTTIREVTPNAKVTCQMPAWTKVGATRFTASMAKCTPPRKPGEGKVVVELMGLAQMRYNNTLFAMCPTGP